MDVVRWLICILKAMNDAAGCARSYPIGREFPSKLLNEYFGLLLRCGFHPEAI